MIIIKHIKPVPKEEASAVLDWLKKNRGEFGVKTDIGFCFEFEYEEDAIAFRLKFGV